MGRSATMLLRSGVRRDLLGDATPVHDHVGATGTDRESPLIRLGDATYDPAVRDDLVALRERLDHFLMLLLLLPLRPDEQEPEDRDEGTDLDDLDPELTEIEQELE